MALSDITFERKSGGLNREAAGEDHISGLLYYGTKPAGFGTDDQKQIFSPEEGEDLGITETALPILHYHVSEYFRVNPNGNLHIRIQATSGSSTFTGVKEIQYEADGTIRQLGVYTQDDLALTQLTTLQTLKDTLDAEHMPLSIGLAANIAGVTLADLIDVSTAKAPGVSVIIGQSGAGTGASLYSTIGKSITCLGAWLGAVSKSSIEESVGWVQEYDMAGTELDVVAFANGAVYKTTPLALRTAVENKHYTFLVKHVGYTGTFFNFDYTADKGDYERVAFNRAIDKAIRNIRTALVPSLNAPVFVDPSTGYLSRDTVDNLEAKGNAPISEMTRKQEISGGRLSIDPKQNVLQNDTILCEVEIVPVGASKSIKVSIGLTAKLSS